MKNKRPLLDYLIKQPDDSEAIPFYPIIEVAGDHRVLVENHNGVIQYSKDAVGIRVEYGIIMICGQNLILCHMTKVKLVITGRIQQITLSRRGDTC